MRYLSKRNGMLVGLALLIISIYWIVHFSLLSSSVTLDAAPAAAIIKLDNKVLKPGTYHVRSGRHNVSISMNGFYSYNQSFTVASRGKRYVAQALLPSSPDTAGWYDSHPYDQKKAEAISSRNFDATSAQQVAEAPILKQLPYINVDPYFKIDYGASKKHPGDPNAFAIYIYANNEDAKNQALAWIKSQGADPSQLEIIYP